MKPSLPLSQGHPRPNIRLDPHEQPLRDMPDPLLTPRAGLVLLLACAAVGVVVAGLFWWVWSLTP